MENKTQNNSDHFDEITFSELKSFFKSLANSAGLGFYKLVRYIIKNIVYLLILVALGYGLGYFLEHKSKEKANTFDLTESDKLKLYEVVVVPNYGSVDFIIDWIKHFENEGSKDSLTDGIKEVKIQGIENIYDLMDESEMNVHTLAILNSKLQRYQELLYNSATNKKYRYQKISFLVSESFDFSTFFKSFQKKIADEAYYQTRKDIEMDKLILRKDELNRSIVQINTILDSGTTSGKSEDLADLVIEKDNLWKNLAAVELKIEEGKEVLYEVYRFETSAADAVQSKIKKGRGNKFGKEIKLPVLFIFLFLVGNLGVRTYKRHNALSKSNE